MKVRYPAHVYKDLVNRFPNLNIPFSSSQMAALDDDERVLLSNSQIDQIIDQLCSETGLGGFVEEHASELAPVSVSLFVANEDTWKMMKRKPWDNDKMLAMFTIPYCFWSKHKEGGKNPKGVNRWDIDENDFSFSANPVPVVAIEGRGGDFSGFIEERMIKSMHFGLPGSTRLVPHYEFKSTLIEVSLSSALINIHPMPKDILDYDFSDPAKVFHDHGLHLSAPGQDFNFQVEKGKSASLRDTVHLFIGTRSTRDYNDLRLLFVDIWLRAFQKFVGPRNSD